MQCRQNRECLLFNCRFESARTHRAVLKTKFLGAYDSASFPPMALIAAAMAGGGGASTVIGGRLG